MTKLINTVWIFTKLPVWNLVLAALVFIFGLAVFVWKPGIYILSAALFVYFVLRSVFDESYRKAVKKSSVVKYSILMFAFGIVLALIAMQQPADLFWFARKTFVLLVIPPLCLAFREKIFVLVGFAGTTLGFLIAAGITLLRNWGNFGQERIFGTWPGGTWDTLIAMYALSLLVVIFRGSTEKATQLMLALIFSLAAYFVILAGGRATWIALVVSATLYLVVNNRKLIPLALFVMGLGISSLFWLSEQRYDTFMTRASSVIDTHDNASNWTRQQLWNLTVQHLKSYAANEPSKLVFGAGSESYLAEHKTFFPEMKIDAVDRDRLLEYGFPSGDPHNSYLDAIARSGLIWAISIIIFLGYLSAREVQNSRRFEGVYIYLYFLIVGMFYSLIPSFSLFFLVWFMLITPNLFSRPKREDSLPCCPVERSES